MRQVIRSAERSGRAIFTPIDAGPLRTGMTMDANLIVSRRENALLVPSRALKGSAVWVMDEGRVRRREVRKGVSGSERTEIVSGLAEGEMVVLSPAESLREGQRARAAAAAASSPPGPSAKR